MPGILGHVSFIAQPDPKRLLKRMAGTMQREAHHRPALWDASTLNYSAGFASVDTGEAIGLAEWDGTILVFFGYIAEDNLRERMRAMPAAAAAQKILSPAETLLSLYRHCGPSALCQLNGQYTVAVWDGREQALHLINDRLGIQPVYYWHSRGQFVFSTEIKSILAYPGVVGQVDPQAVFELFTCGHPLDERTFYRDIHALPPATLLTYSGSSAPRLETYWTMPLYQSGDPAPAEGEYIEGFLHRMEQAVKRIPNDPQRCLLLTGGLDSRLLAGMLAKTSQGNAPVLANTIGHDRARDRIYAAQIAAELGLSYSVIPINPRYVADYAEKTAARTEGSMNSFASWIFDEDEYLREHGVRYVITGVGAEAISGRHMLAEHHDPDAEAAVQYLFGKHWETNKAAALFQPALANDLRQTAMESYRRSIHDAPSDDPISRYDYAHIRQHRRHPTGNLLNDHALAVEPFYDNDLVDYALRCPPALRAQYYRIAIARAFPRLARLATTENNRSLTQDLRLPPLPGMNLVKRAEKAIQRRLRWLDSSLPIGDNPTNTVYYNHWLRTESRKFVTRALSEEMCFDNLFDASTIRRLLNDHMSGKKNEYRLICALVTFIQMRRQYR